MVSYKQSSAEDLYSLRGKIRSLLKEASANPHEKIMILAEVAGETIAAEQNFRVSIGWPRESPAAALRQFIDVAKAIYEAKAREFDANPVRIVIKKL